MGYLDTFWYFGNSIGLALQPIIQNAWGYDGIFITSIVLYLVASAYVILRLRPGTSGEPRDKEVMGKHNCNDI